MPVVVEEVSVETLSESPPEDGSSGAAPESGVRREKQARPPLRAELLLLRERAERVHAH